MKKTQFITVSMLFFIVLMLSYACSKTKSIDPEIVSNNPVNSNGNITLIVSRADLRESAKDPNSSLTLVASVVLYNGFTASRELLGEVGTDAIAPDTLTFYTNSYNNPLYLSITNSQDMYSYLAHPGDTLFVNFKGDKPFVISTWKDQKKYDFIWQNEIEFRIGKLYPDKIINKEKKFHLKTAEDYKMIDQYLDSLFRGDLLSKQVYDYAKTDVKCFIDGLSCPSNDKKNKFSLDLFYQNDTAFSSNTYRSMLSSYMYRDIDFRNYNPIDLFDDVISDTMLTFKSRSYLLFKVLKDISTANNTAIFTPKAAEFLNFVNNDSIWKQYIEMITPVSTIVSKEMQLYDINMKQVDFANQMNFYKGKVVYIDVWASWCGPCRAAMPAAKDLREKYKDKPVVFLYLAYNDQQNSWKKGVSQYNLNEGNAASFLIASPEAQWIKDMEIKSIPRYMIYDKEGKLINKNAPDPKNSYLVELLNSLL